MASADEDTELLKKWTIKRLEDISDADSDVLADYVLALVKSDDPEPVAKANCVENLKDFLGDSTSSFVDQVFSAIATKQYDPSVPQPKPVAPRHQIPNRPSFDQQRPAKQNRKRSYRDLDSEMQDGGMFEDNDAGRRPMKQMRRGGRVFDQRAGRQQHWQAAPFMQGSSAQAMPQGFPQFDPSDPWAMLNAMNQMIGMMTGAQPGSQSKGPPPFRQRCKDYDTQGFCMGGAACPYEHGENPYVVPRGNLEYDPNNAGLFNPSFSKGDSAGHASERGRGGARRRARGGSKWRGGNPRADFSLNGPTRDKSITTIVVEQIPEDKCDEDTVREYFSKFGEIESIDIDSPNLLAIIKYDSHDAAKSAYDSPQSIFDNRFVKVYWHRQDSQGQANGHGKFLPPKPRSRDVDMSESEQIDPEEVAKRVEEAQRKYDETKKSREDADKQRLDLEAKLKAMDVERKKMADALAKKSGSPPGEGGLSKDGEDNEKTKSLKEQLAKLEEEAKSLGIDPNAPSTDGYVQHPPYRGRGGFRGRGRGRGSFFGYRGGRGGATGGVMRLDNRPKTLAFVFSDDGATFSSHEEKLGQFMLFNSLPFAAMSKHPERDDAALVAFEQRFQGENTMALARDGQELPYIGNVQLSWYQPSLTNGSAAEAKLETVTNGNQSTGDHMETLATRQEESYGNGDDQDLDHF